MLKVENIDTVRELLHDYKNRFNKLKVMMQLEDAKYNTWGEEERADFQYLMRLVARDLDEFKAELLKLGVDVEILLAFR